MASMSSGWWLNSPTAASDASVETNASVIERLGEVPVLGTVPHLAGRLSANRLRQCVIPALDLTDLLEEFGP